MIAKHFLCLSVLAGRHHLIAPRSTKDNCSICIQDVWKSPSADKIIAENNLEIVCEECFENIYKNQKVVIQSPTPEQFEEMKETFM